jgi:two-component sensor histidine kinase
MIFLEQNGELALMDQWRSREVANRYLAVEMIRKGPATQTFRSGKCTFWSQARRCRLDIARYLRRLFPGPRPRSVAFLPLCMPDGKTFGVLAMVLVHPHGFTHDVKEDVLLLRRIFAGYIGGARGCEEFLSVVSHELRNPLTPILGWAVALRSGIIPRDKQTSAIEGIARNARVLNALIEDLLDVARISSGRFHLDPEQMRIQDIINEVLTSVQQAAESKKLRIALDIPEAIPSLLADPQRIRQVLLNLLNNAVKFTPSGGTIGVRVARHGGFVTCVISDSGQGIAPDFLPYVFDSFRQERREKARAAGVGLGLAIVRQIVELHGGTIKVQSRGPDRGATFVVRLPIRRRGRKSL